MIFIFPKPVAFLGLLTILLFSPVLAVASSSTKTEINLDEYRLPPKDIKDILRVLETSKINLTDVERAKKIAAMTPPPESVGNEALNAFYARRAIANQKLGRLSAALADAKFAAFTYKSSNLDFRNRDLGDYAVLQSFMGNYPEMIKALEDSKNELEKLYPRFSGRLLSNKRLLVIAYSRQGEFKKAEQVIADMENQFVAMRHHRSFGMYGNIWQSQVYSAKGTYYSRTGNWTQSETFLRQANALLKNLHTSATDKSIDEFADGPRVSSDSSNTPRYMATQLISRGLDLSGVLLEQRKLLEAEHYAREGLRVSLDTFGKNSSDVGRCLSQLSKIVSEQGRSAESLLLAKAALEAQIDSGLGNDSLTLALAKKFYATALVGDGKYREADKYFSEIHAVAKKNPESFKGFSSNDLDWVFAQYKIGKFSEANQMSRAMLDSYRSNKNNDPYRLAILEAFHATILQAENKHQEAFDLFQSALPILIDQSRSDMVNDTSTIKQQQRNKLLLEGYLSTLAKLAVTDAAKQEFYVAESFKVADLAKGSGVQRALTASAARASIKDAQLSALARNEQDLQKKTASLAELLTTLLSAPPELQAIEVQAQIRSDIERYKLDRDRIKKEIARKFPDYSELVEPKPATIDKTKKLLKPDEILVSWYFGDKEGYLWSVSKDEAAFFKAIPLSQSQMSKQVSQLRKSLDPSVSSVEEIPPYDVGLAYKLYQHLLGSIEESFANKKTMLVVPHAELGQLPLSVLVTRGVPQPAKIAAPVFMSYRAVPWLAKKIAITQLPSVTALAALRDSPHGDNARKSFIGFGDPYFSADQKLQADKLNAKTQLATRGIPIKLRSAPKSFGVSSAELALLPRLPDTSEEILDIAKVLNAESSDIYLNQKASVKSVMGANLSNHKVVMFATHGLVPGELNGLTQPALALSSPEVTGDKDDGLLTMDKIINLKLNADWVILSACNTASGDGGGSEAVSGLGRAFFYAGARALLVSNWPVDSEASRHLMTDLFKRSQANKSLSKSEALRQSMVNLIEHEGAKNGNVMSYSYAHPLFWAPFIVVGD